MIANARWYHRNIDIRNALNVPSLQQFIQKLAKIFYGKLPDINNPEITKIPVYDHNDKQNRTGSCSAPATIPQDPDGLPPTHPLPPTTAADHLTPRTEIIQHHQRAIARD
ncbi:hypothetical protein AVEN_22032-1 [Araneus ventricosus]|uniref:Uncharacterized protein n=1 Tax=Araneus ventricosus TaxID=182803 RepID=A0A4Y2NZX4_ARAVE|nr:hypothetical protein AVEN_22032-1 [Araneus ventricosus]